MVTNNLKKINISWISYLQYRCSFTKIDDYLTYQEI